MFHRHFQLYSKLLLAADVGTGLLALYLAYHLRYYLIQFVPGGVAHFFNPELLPFREYLFYFLLFLPAWIFFLMLTQRYSGVVRLPIGHQALRALQFVVIVGFLMGFLTYSFKLLVSRPVFFSFLGLVIVGLVLNRTVAYFILRRRNGNEHNQVNILIAGTDERARQVGKLVEAYSLWGYHMSGYIAIDDSTPADPDLKVVGSLKDLPQLLQQTLVADEIIFMGSPTENVERFGELVRICEELGVRTRIAADFFPTSTARVSLEFLENLPLITFSTVPDHTLSLAAKRALDCLVAAGVLVLLSPAMLMTAILIKFTSPGPILYRQVRCGRYMRKFRLIKFRTMIDGAEDKLWEIRHLNEMTGPVFKMRDDPRVTPLGRFLRKFSIDELPQLWNVIKGEMSIVGPRAPLPEEVQHYATRQRRRLSVKPGITCLWQVSGRNEIDFEEWMKLDLQYIDNWSLWLDIRIMLKTIPAVFTGYGAR